MLGLRVETRPETVILRLFSLSTHYTKRGGEGATFGEHDIPRPRKDEVEKALDSLRQEALASTFTTNSVYDLRMVPPLPRASPVKRKKAPSISVIARCLGRAPENIK